MPIIKKSSYQSRPYYLPSKHLETIVPSLFYKVKKIKYDWERVDLIDGDFLDLGWLKNNNKRLIIACHGMEGNASANYIMRSAKFFHERNWDYLAWNYRGCSEEPNKLPKHYYYGGIEDFQVIIDHALGTGLYDQIVLLGFSMGGCLVNKYLGTIKNIDSRIKGSVSYSVSCDLKDSIYQVENKSHKFYGKIFKRSLIEKLKKKANIFSELEDIPIEAITSFDTYNQYCTLPYHDFNSINEFYEKSSCVNYLEGIKLPSLMINALNDPILGSKCYPYDIAGKHDFLHLETPKHGAHLGFTLQGKDYSWMELRAEEFINSHII